MDKEKAAAELIAAALPLVPFEGWTQRTLNEAAEAAGYKRTDAIRIFPNGTMQAVEYFLRQQDAAMTAALQQYNLDTMKIRERIATIVRVRITLHESHREALRRAMALLSLPFNAHIAFKHLYKTVDAIWVAAGDTSTDFNFYTKRLMLAGVYSSTLLYWLDDQSAGYENSWAFLDRRIGDVMRIEKAKYKIKNLVERLSA